MGNRVIRCVFFLLLAVPWAEGVLAERGRNPSLRPHEIVNTNVKEYEWEEGAATLPPYPEEGDLLEFDVDLPKSPFRYYIDSRSLSYNPIDGVVRYTLVIRSSKGGENVAFEGMRCNAREYKVYALGNGRGKLRPHPNPRWKMIAETGYTRYRTDLARNYLCSAKLETMDREQILRNIRYGLDSKDTLYH